MHVTNRIYIIATVIVVRSITVIIVIIDAFRAEWGAIWTPKRIQMGPQKRPKVAVRGPGRDLSPGWTFPVGVFLRRSKRRWRRSQGEPLRVPENLAQ